MTRLIVQALLAGVAAAFLLLQLSRTEELLAWELLLLALLVWQLREIPGRTDVLVPPLFDFDPPDKARLPRTVSATELTTVDAVSGYMSPERRLRPMLTRIANHRLRRRGIPLDSPAAVSQIGEASWRWLMSASDEAPEAKELERLITRLEDL